MRYRIIVLLAVSSSIAAAGPLRHNGARPQHQNVARFLNHTEITSVAANIQTPKYTSTSSTSVTLSIAANPESSTFTASSPILPAAIPLTPNVASGSSSAVNTLTMSMPGQVQTTSATLQSTSSATPAPGTSEASSGTYPVTTSALVSGENSNGETSEAAAIQPAETKSRLFNIAESPANDQQSSISAPSSPSTLSPALSLSTLTMSNVPSTFKTPKVAATTSSSFLGYLTPSPSSEGASPTSSSAAFGQMASSSITLVTTSSSVAASQSLSQVIVPVPISSGVVQVLGAGGDTADEFAPVTLNSSAPTPTGTVTYPTAKGGNIAMANGFNNVFAKLNSSSSCNPSDPNEAYACISGEIAECQADETYVLKSCPRFQSCYALPKPSGLAGIVVQCAEPSYAASVRAGLSLSTAGPVAVSSQPAQLLQAEGDSSEATQSGSTQTPIQPAPSSASVQATVQSQTVLTASSVTASTASGSRDQGYGQVDRSAVSTGKTTTSAQSASPNQAQALDPPVLAGTATAQRAAYSNSLENTPMIETSSQIPSTTQAVYSVPSALFAVVTAPVSGQASVISPQASPSSLPPTLTSGVDGSSTTFAPTGVPLNEKVAVGNGQVTVTVTVTVTSTEKLPPVTIVAS